MFGSAIVRKLGKTLEINYRRRPGRRPSGPELFASLIEEVSLALGSIF